MPAFDLVAAAFFAAAIAGSAAFLVVRALAAWQTFRSFNRSAGDAFERVNAGAAAAEARAASLSDRAERLAVATTRARESFAHLAALNAALGEVQQHLNRIRGSVPHK